MPLVRIFFLLTLAAAFGLSQTGPRNLGFEEGRPGEPPPGWNVATATGFAARLTAQPHRSGDQSVEAVMPATVAPNAFGNLSQTFDATPYRGKRVRFRAALRTDFKSGDRAQLWLRVDRPNGETGAFDNMSDRPLLSALDWTLQEIVADVDADADRILFGLIVFGTGRVWMDDVTFEVLGDSPAPTIAPSEGRLSFERLGDAVKLWAYAKYLHPRATAPGVDLDRAFETAATKIVRASGDAASKAAVNEMLAALGDPGTALVPVNEDPRRIFIVKKVTGVRVVSLEVGSESQLVLARNAMAAQLAGPVVFDMRGGPNMGYLLPALSVVHSVTMPYIVSRVHSGYANQLSNVDSGGYTSSWETSETGKPLPASSTTMRAVFLVDRDSAIPPVVAAMVYAGEAALVSESATPPVGGAAPRRVFGKLNAFVRDREFLNRDGTVGVAVNVVLNKTGQAALDAAMELARSGVWPQAAPRPRFDLPPANYTERSTTAAFPGAASRLPAVARIWGVFHYFHPYAHLYGEDWDAVLVNSLEKAAAAKHAREYQMTIAEMLTHVHDSHVSVNSATLYSVYGQTSPPVEVRWIENQPVITRVASGVTDVRAGDVITHIDGRPPMVRIAELTPYIPASTKQALMSRVSGYLLNGPDGSTVIVGLRGADGAEREVSLKRAAANSASFRPHRQSEVFHLLTDKIGYADLERLTNADVDAMFELFQNTDTIILDMRGYPQGTAWSIAPRLSEASAPVAAQFRRNVVGANAIEGNTVTTMLFEQRLPTTDKPRYKGKTIMLIDERAISQSEHSGLFYRVANETVFIGTLAAGANGDVTAFTVPGGITIPFSGHDVRWPDGTQLQRVGLVPDVAFAPTIAGIRSGRDEILERAIVFAQNGR